VGAAAPSSARAICSDTILAPRAGTGRARKGARAFTPRTGLLPAPSSWAPPKGVITLFADWLRSVLW